MEFTEIDVLLIGLLVNVIHTIIFTISTLITLNQDYNDSTKRK